MSSTPRVGLISVEPIKSTGKLTDPIAMEITFECYEDLEKEIEWEMAMAWDGEQSNDQVLDSVEVGPLQAGKHKFVFEAEKAPDYTKVKDEDVIDVAVLFVRCSYRGAVFARVAFFVAHVYTDEALRAEPPKKPQLDKLERIISLEDVRVTTFQIKWASTDSLMPPVEETEEQANAEPTVC